MAYDQRLCASVHAGCKHEFFKHVSGIGGLVAEYIVAIDVTRVRFPADASIPRGGWPLLVCGSGNVIILCERVIVMHAAAMKQAAPCRAVYTCVACGGHMHISFYV